jgi:hypothetical protein
MKKLYFVILFPLIILPHINAQSSLYKISTDSLIIAALAMINADSLQADVQAMQDMGTRFMIAPNRKDAATWVMNKFLSFGIEEVRLDSFICTNSIHYPPIIYDTVTWQYNVEARIEGSEYPQDEVVLVAHYDDCTQDYDPIYFAPGADDNASGTSATLECARIIMEMGYQPAQTIIFLASAAEELMYYGDAGTEHYAMEAQAAGRNIVMVINNDMISWDDGTWTLDLFTHVFSQQITGMAINIIEDYTSLNYYAWAPVQNVGGDIQPFLDAGYPGIYFMEQPINPNYHSINDLVDSCDFPYLAEATKVSLGCMLKSDITVGLKETRPGFHEIDVNPNPASNEINFYLNGPVSSSWDLNIISTNGTEVYKGICPPGSNKLNISFLPEGIYLMIFHNNEHALYQKLVILR